MKIIDLEQGSPEWIAWRFSGVGASESPCLLMKNHPWMTPYKLACLKIGLLEPEAPNWAMIQGTKKEPHVREWFCKNYFKIEPICAEMDNFPFIKASLDGWSEDEDAIVEIKVTGKDNQALAKNGGIPHQYRIQIQHQLLVSGASKAYYVSYLSAEGDFAVVEELPDETFQQEIFLACKDFWARVQTRDLPPPSDKDELVGGVEFNSFLERYFIADKAEKAAKSDKAKLKERLVECYSHDKVRGVRGRVFKRKQPGRIDMDLLTKTCKAHGIDPETFRKEDSYHWVIQEIKEEK